MSRISIHVHVVTDIQDDKFSGKDAGEAVEVMYNVDDIHPSSANVTAKELREVTGVKFSMAIDSADVEMASAILSLPVDTHRLSEGVVLNSAIVTGESAHASIMTSR